MRSLAKAVVPACIAVLLLVWASPLHAEVKNLSGTWKFSEKSTYFGQPAKSKLMIKIVHNEPAIKYSITGIDGEGNPMNNEFDGAIDGKPYKETYKETGGGTGTLKRILKRINDSTIEWTTIFPDGKTTETSTLVVSKDGKVFTRKGAVKGEGGYEFSEVWEKQ